MNPASPRQLAGFLFATMLLVSGSAAAKGSICSPEYEQQIRATYFEGGSISRAKVDQTIARLKQKKIEIAGLLAGKEELTAESKGKEAKQKKIKKAIEGSKSLFTLDQAIAFAESLKSTSSFADVCDAAVAISDLEGAIRIEGLSGGMKEGLTNLKAELSAWKIPKSSQPSAQASNLVSSDGTVLNAQAIAALEARGADLSVLEPANDSPFYNPVPDISRVDVRQAAVGSTIKMYEGLQNVFPQDATFIYDGIKKSDTKPKIDATIDGIKDTKFKLKFQAEFSSDPVVNALMMTLGFPGDLSKHQSHLRVVLPKGISLHDVKRDWESYFSRDQVAIGGVSSKIETMIESTSTDSKGQTVVVFKDGLIEAHPDAIKRVGGWVYSEGDHNSRREVRGMMLIQMWLDNSDIKEFGNNQILLRENANGSASRLLIDSDVGHTLGWLYLESPSMYSWNMISSTSGSTIDFRYRNIHPLSLKNKITLADARWAARLIAQLTREQITQAIALGGTKECVQQAFVERMISRRNDLVTGLDLVGAKLANGKTIELIPVSNDHDRFDIENICKWNAGGKAETERYGFNAGSVVGPLLVTAKRQLMNLARASVGGNKRFVYRTKAFHLSGPHPIGEVLFNIGRKVERNPSPKTENDLFIVKDTLEVGIRAGVTVGPYVDVVQRISWELAYPARSQAEASTSNGFIVNLLLPLEQREGKLPESYVLKTEHSFEVGKGIELDNLPAPFSPTIQAGIGRVKAWRSIYDHRDASRVVLYRDRQDYTQAELDVFVRLAILKIPVLEQIKSWGNALGKGVTFSADDMKNQATQKAVDQAVVDGDFSTLATRETDFFTTDAFQHSLRKWNFLVWKGTAERRLDRVQIDADEDKKILQFKTSKGSVVSIIGPRREKNIVVELYANPSAPQEMELAVNVMGTDVNTSDQDMTRKYLRFINGLSTNGQPVIQLTPSLGYTTDGNWGNTLTESSTTYTTEGMKRILAATPEQFWNALASSMNVSRASLDSLRSGADRTQEQDVVIEHANNWVREVARAAAESKLEKRVARLAEAVRKAVFSDHVGFYNPAILGALNRLAGDTNFDSRNLITVPTPLAMNLPEGTPAFGRAGTPQTATLKYLIYAPATAVDLYTMFDTWF